MTATRTRVSTIALLGLAAAALAPNPAAAADPTGTWFTEDGRARVRTEHCGPGGAQLCGYVVWGSKPLGEDGKPKIDRYNPDPKRQVRPLLGHQMILGLKKNEDGRFAGKIYNGDNGKSYDVTIWSEAPAELSVKGCLLSVLCQTQTWTRVTDVVPGQLTAATDTPGGPHADPEWAAPKSAAAPKPAAAKPVGAAPK